MSQYFRSRAIEMYNPVIANIGIYKKSCRRIFEPDVRRAVGDSRINTSRMPTVYSLPTATQLANGIELTNCYTDCQRYAAR
jgi:hypothetical protein